MIEFPDPILWVIIVIASVWLYRACRVIISHHSIPIVRPRNPKSALSSTRITVLIPVKNEEKNIRDCLECFSHQDHPHIQIIVANDSSTDRTEEILKSMDIPRIGDNDGQRPEHKIAYFNCPPTPSGWTGKNYALHTVVPFARGDWFLFTDADTRHDPHSISSSLQHAESRDLEYLTLTPRCIADTFVERFILPLAMLSLGMHFPLDKVNHPDSEMTFGNGQYLMIKRGVYEKIEGHDKVRAEFLEDYAITKNVKALGARFECAIGTEIYGTRMYDSFDTIWIGWRRIILHAFRKNILVMSKYFFNVLLFSVFPFLAFIPLTLLTVADPYVFGFSWCMGFTVLFFILITNWKAFAFVKAQKAYALFHPLSAFFIAMILMDAIWIAVSKKETKWR